MSTFHPFQEESLYDMVTEKAKEQGVDPDAFRKGFLLGLLHHKGEHKWVTISYPEWLREPDRDILYRVKMCTDCEMRMREERVGS